MDQIRNTYIFDNEYETLLEFDDRVPEQPSDQITETRINPQPTYWTLTPKFQKLYDKFQDNILLQWPRIACVYCGKLLYPEKANWELYDFFVIYPLQQR